MRLLAIEFVLDYLVLRFDGDVAEPQVTLSCDVLPQVEAGDGSQLRDGAPGFSDALRELVGDDVIAADEGTGTGLRISLGSTSLVINPTSEDLVGPEIALLRGFADGAWMCWRPGEGTFERRR